MGDNTYVDVAYAVISRMSGREPYAGNVGDLAGRLRPVVDQCGMLERAELVAWLCTPLSELQGRPPAEVIWQGQTQSVLDLLRQRGTIT